MEGDKFNRKEKERGSNGCASIIFLAVNIAEVIVGVMYWDDCNLEAAKYLYYSGILGLSVSAISLFFTFCLGFMACCAACDNKISDGEACALGVGCCLHWLVQMAVGVTQIVIMIWGFAVIFPSYSTWEYENVPAENDNFCHYTPYMFAFVLLIIQCVVLCLVAPCIICCCFCGAAGAAFSAVNRSEV